ncbi:MAG: hypothetical protein U1E05_06730, partial [Patescibacteria group bacterium]|nr:hypothetical protein [Patescibacteria group bacterium]
MARAAERWSTWQTLQLTGPEFTATDATKPDRRLMRERNVLSFTAHSQRPAIRPRDGDSRFQRGP